MPSKHGRKRTLSVNAHGLRHSDAGRGWQSFLVVLNDALRSLCDPAEIERQACTLLVQALGVDRVTYVEFSAAEDRFTVSRDAPDNRAATTVGEYRLVDFAWAVEVFKRSQCVAVEDTQHSPLIPEELRSALAAISVIGCIGAPVIRGGELLGALLATVPHPRGWKYEEIWLLENASERVWATMLQARTTQALEAKSAELERQAVQLRKLASDLTLAEHNTRQLVSKTLHDGLQQFLVATKFALDSALEQSGPRESLVRARSNLMEAIKAARSLSIDLFPPVLHNSGLPEALQWLASWMHKKYGKDVVVRVDTDADPSGREARILMFESVRELIFNSVKHANTPAIVVTVDITPEDEVCVEVADDGKGFSSETVFDTNSTSASLGLVAIRERLKILGGSMVVDSRPGHGCRVKIQIPRALKIQEVSSALPLEAPSTVRLSSTTAGMDVAKHPIRVLIVDDHQVCREGIFALLSVRPELEVVGEAADGAEALRKVAELEPDAVVMDVSMPVLDGIQATAQITRHFPGIKVFGLSMDSVNPNSPHPIQRAGASGFFSKEHGAQSLIDALIREHHSLQARF